MYLISSKRLGWYSRVGSSGVMLRGIWVLTPKIPRNFRKRRLVILTVRIWVVHARVHEFDPVGRVPLNYVVLGFFDVSVFEDV